MKKVDFDKIALKGRVGEYYERVITITGMAFTADYAFTGTLKSRSTGDETSFTMTANVGAQTLTMAMDLTSAATGLYDWRIWYTVSALKPKPFLSGTFNIEAA